MHLNPQTSATHVAAPPVGTGQWMQSGPHVAGSTIEARENMGRIAAEQALDILDGRRPPRLVNPEVWPKYRERFARIMGFTPDA